MFNYKNNKEYASDLWNSGEYLINLSKEVFAILTSLNNSLKTGNDNYPMKDLEK